MTPHKFIPPKDDDFDYNPIIDEMIQEEIDRGNNQSEEDIEDWDDVDDIKFVL